MESRRLRRCRVVRMGLTSACRASWTLLERNSVSATCLVPGVTAERYPDLIRRTHDAGHELAHHGYLHVSPAKQTEEEERAALEKGLEVLQKLTGERPVGHRAPSW